MKKLKSTRNGGKVSNSCLSFCDKDSVRLQFRAFNSSVPASYLSDWKERTIYDFRDTKDST